MLTLVRRPRLVIYMWLLLAATLAMSAAGYPLSAHMLTQATPVAPPQAQGAAYAVVGIQLGTDEDKVLAGEVVAFNAATGAIHTRLTTGDQPDILVAPSGDRLYLLETTWSGDFSTPTHWLSLIDTRSWALLARTSIPNRALHTVTGPSTLALAPDGKSLLIYSIAVLEDDRADYSLIVVDVPDLAVRGSRISLPDCGGGAEFGTAGEQVVVLCNQSQDVRFVDVQGAKVVATLPLPGPPAGLRVPPDGQAFYVVLDDLNIMQINTASREVTREMRGTQQESTGVASPGSVAIRGDGSQLLVGVLAEHGASSSPVLFQPIGLPSLEAAPSVPLPGHYSRFAPAPGGGLYIFPSWGEGTSILWFHPELGTVAPLLQVGGSIHRVVS